MNQKTNELEINGVVYVPKESRSELAVNTDGLKAVLIRSYAAGVHFGYLRDEKFTEAGKVVTLVNTRRVWYWDGAASLSQMALEGVKKPENCKVSVVLAENEIVNVIETIPLTEKAVTNLFGIAIWKQ
ncbi:MAG: hypothetical protein WCI57_04270 [Candidatus Berkelbacteria bacterium]